MNQTFNISNGTSSRHCLRDTTVTHVVFPLLYTVVFLLGLMLNSLSIWIFWRVPSSSIFIVYLKNTLVADLIMTLMLPFKILTDSGIAPWQLKAFVCRFSAVIFYESMYINLIFLGLIGLDRFNKIVWPFGKKWIYNVCFAKCLSAAVWLCMFGITLPNIILTNQKATPITIRKCASLKSPSGIKWHEAVNYLCQFIFWAVLILLVLFYTIITKRIHESYTKSRSKDGRTTKKIRVKVFIVIAVFFVCFAPFHFVRVPYTFSQTGKIIDCNMQNKLFLAKESTLWLATTNVLMDPIIFVLLCKQFRELLLRYTSYRSTSMETHIYNESTV
ncbi:P2Y purinoceptor 13 [Discoglossus pictus]